MSVLAAMPPARVLGRAHEGREPGSSTEAGAATAGLALSPANHERARDGERRHVQLRSHGSPRKRRPDVNGPWRARHHRWNRRPLGMRAAMAHALFRRDVIVVLSMSGDE